MSVKKRLARIAAHIPRPIPDMSGYSDQELREIVMMRTRRAWWSGGDHSPAGDPIAEAVKELHSAALMAIIEGPAGMKRISNTILEDKANDIEGL